MEFVDKESVENALKLDDSTFKGRQLKVGSLVDPFVAVKTHNETGLHTLPGAA